VSTASAHHFRTWGSSGSAVVRWPITTGAEKWMQRNSRTPYSRSTSAICATAGSISSLMSFIMGRGTLTLLSPSALMWTEASIRA